MSRIESFVCALLVVAFAACNANDSPSPGQPPVTPVTPEEAPRRRVLVEIDRMEGLTAIANTDRLVEIYSAAGIDLEIRDDESDLPHSPAVRLADLHAIMKAFGQLEPEPEQWKLHVLLVTRDVDDDATLGIMFDYGETDDNDIPREGCAVFVDAHTSGNVADEILLTTAHELAHCLNLHHTDWEGTSFHNDATIESYSFADTVRWQLSESSKNHLAEHRGNDDRMVKPGPGGINFGTISREHANAHQSTPVEDYVVLARRPTNRTPRQLDTGRAAAERSRSDSSLRLTLAAPKQTFAPGEPVYVEATLKNVSEQERNVYQQLNPRDHLLHVEIREPSTAGFRSYRPPVWACAKRGPAPLAAGQSVSASFPVFFGAGGWNFTQPGTYRIRASCPGAPDAEGVIRSRVLSDELTVRVEAPPTEAARRTRDALLATEARNEVGLYLFLNGADHLQRADRVLDKVWQDKAAVDPAQRAAIGIALSAARVGPSVADPSLRVAPDLDAAERYLEGALREDIDAELAIKGQRACAEELEKAGRKTESERIMRQIDDYREKLRRK